MTSTTKKVTVNFDWNIDTTAIPKGGSIESKRFGTTNTVFYLEANKNEYTTLYLHLESSQDEKIFFDLKLKFSAGDSYPYMFSGGI